jgi:hypothetical protein
VPVIIVAALWTSVSKFQASLALETCLAAPRALRRAGAMVAAFA